MKKVSSARWIYRVVNTSNDLNSQNAIQTGKIAEFLKFIASFRSPKTVLAYSRALKWVRQLLEAPLESATPDDFGNAFLRLLRGHSASTVNQAKSAVRQFLEYVGKHELVRKIKNS